MFCDGHWSMSTRFESTALMSESCDQFAMQNVDCYILMAFRFQEELLPGNDSNA